MDIKTVNNLIDELEQEEVSLSTIRNLSSLYIVRKHLIGNVEVNTTVKELRDILPSYMRYIDVKRKYQLHEISIDNILIELKNVCKEIKEFIQTLYSSTDTQEERELLQILIDELKAL